MILETQNHIQSRTQDSDVKKMSPDACAVCGSHQSVDWLRAPDRFHRRDKIYQLKRCSSCTLVWQDKPPSPEEMPEHYGTQYHQTVVASVEEDLMERWRKPRERISGMCTGGTILDIGCSSGGFLRSLPSDKWKLNGIEISQQEAKMAEQRTGAQVYVGDLLDAPFPGGTFDVITAFHVFEHAYDPKEFIRKVHHWLKPGGVFYIQIPNIEAAEARLFRSYWFGLEMPRHTFHFSPGSLHRLFAGTGFEEVLIRTLPDCYIEKSIRYVFDEACTKVGIARSPLAEDHDRPGIPWRIVRKLFRLGVLWPFRRLAVLAGRGPAIEAAFRKEL